MLNVLAVCWHYLRAFALLYLCLYAGMGIAALLPFPLPGSIIGMLILFTLLTLRILPVDWIRPSCHLLIRYMVLLFVPISVGIMNYTDILSAQFGPIVIACTVSTFIVLITTGYSSHYFQRRRITQEPDDE